MNIDEDADLAERFAEIEPGQAFDHADEQSADQRARDRAHAAEHHDGERDQHEGVAGVRVDVIGRHQQAGGDREARGAEPERHRVDVRDVDAGELRAELLLRHRADRLAGVGPAHDEPKRRAPRR